jgi:hypothetical protein
MATDKPPEISMSPPRRMVVCLTTVLALVSAAGAEDLDPAQFESRVRPVLFQACFRCHGDGKVSGELRVDSRAALLKGGESGPAVVPGAPEQSLLVRAIRRADDVSAMPPDEALKPADIEAIVAWIKAGAPWPEASPVFERTRHWAFEPLAKGGPPATRDLTNERNGIDAFVQAKREAAGVEPAPPADRRTLIRRATFDLTGLPPTPEEVAAFENDPSPEAFAAVVERLLQSPHYGEQMGRHWLDVVRYADTAGENTDHPLPHAWRYRNWVIQAFNSDKPFDEFIREQIAGDLIGKEGPPEKYADCVVATGYLAIARRFGHDIDKDMHLTYEDVIDNLGKSVLGLSIGCARCHDHKYDPLTARDYYGLYGIFESTKFAFPGCEPKQQPRDLVPLMPPARFETEVKPKHDQIAALDAEMASRAASFPERARTIREMTSGSTVLSSGMLDDGASRDLAIDGARLDSVSVARGDVLLLSIGPRGNHGADTTQVELAISEISGGRRWNADDLVSDLLVGNPHPVGGANWCFLDGRDGYAFLPERLAETSGRPELKVWRNGDTPSIFVNTSTEPVAVWTKLPPRAFFMHPGPGGSVALAWIAPADLTLRITGRIADAHPGGPDGVDWKLEHCSKAGLSEALLKLGAESSEQLSLANRRQEIAASIAVPVAYAVAEGEGHNTRLQKRGEPGDLGDEVPRKFLDVLGGNVLPTESSSGRRELADWLTNSSNPLTPRVIVNRLWQWHFGRGLAKTPNDFGTRGAPPTHPELLDHLAEEFVRDGWSLKKLHRRIMLSATYQQASVDPSGRGADPSTADLYVSFPRRRMAAEELRDSLLAATGELDRVPGEAHPFPSEASWSFTQHAPFAAEYPTNKRSVYLMQKRNRRDRFFALFDGADPNSSTPFRDATTVPTQALYFLNDPFVHARAEKLAEKIVAFSESDEARLDLALRTLVGRPAGAADRDDFRSFKRELSSLGVEAPGEVWSTYVRVLFSTNEFLYIE